MLAISVLHQFSCEKSLLLRGCGPEVGVENLIVPRGIRYYTSSLLSLHGAELSTFVDDIT